MITLALLAPALIACAVTDGDTLRCGPKERPERVRLLGIDAPELPGHCRRGRVCVPGDGKASKAALETTIQGRQVRLVRYGTDHYGRTLAMAWAGRTNLACAQIDAGQARYRPGYDWRGMVRRSCGR